MTEFELFKDEFTKWQYRFGCNDWRVYFKYEELDDKFACITPEYENGAALVSLNSNVPEKNKPYADILLTAKHEAIHLLLADLTGLAWSRFVSKEELIECEEKLVHKLEGLL